ncbi:hypothetical protein [Motiliproteus coralliicola]|nr:hypothetical protein [Motiliproteus coralliicola]
MRRLVTILAATLILSACQSNAYLTGDSRYTLDAGKAWRGLSVGGKAVRTADVICYGQQCYRLLQTTNLSRELSHKYQLGGLVNYRTLSQAPGIDTDGEKLVLPADIGRPLFLGARSRAWQERGEGSGGVWRH